MNGLEMVGTRWKRTTKARGDQNVTVVEYGHAGLPPARAPGSILFEDEECVRVKSKPRDGGEVWRLDVFLEHWQPA